MAVSCTLAANLAAGGDGRAVGRRTHRVQHSTSAREHLLLLTTNNRSKTAWSEHVIASRRKRDA